MSMRPTMKKCKKCGKLYDWNPDVGQLTCPNCRDKNSMLEAMKELKKLQKK